MTFNLIESGFLKHPQQNHNPCYRKVICYSFFRYIKQTDVETGLNEFIRMAKKVENNQLFLLENFLEIFPTKMTPDDDSGYVIVERSRGCFPLIIYPKSHSHLKNAANKTRKSGLQTAIRKLQNNQSKIFDLLSKHDEWSLDLESKLEKLFGYPQLKSHSNDPRFDDGMPKTGS